MRLDVAVLHARAADAGFNAVGVEIINRLGGFLHVTEQLIGGYAWQARGSALGHAVEQAAMPQTHRDDQLA